jgi:hypothetical protein
VIRAFGILNESVKPGTAQYGIPYPGTYIVDRRGKVVSKYFEDDFRERVSITDILAGRFGQPAAAGGAVQAKRVKLATSASTAVARPGHRILLSLEMDLGPRMHVYSPGVQNYIPVDWKMEESGSARLHAFQYPPGRMMRLKVIDETVPVYRGKARITREITFGPEATLKQQLTPSGELVLKGSFRYQACDDRECYLPETVPLEWRFRFQALDRERVPAPLQRQLR